MTESAPHIDYANLPAPEDGFLVTLFITVRSVARSRDFYSRVLGGTVVLDENPCMVRLSNSWIIMNPGGPPTPDKPGISVVDYEPGDATSIFLNLRVADIQASYEAWKEKGAEFVTPPIDRGAEIRCYMRDPDGYLIEVGQATGVLHGQLAAKRPEDLPSVNLTGFFWLTQLAIGQMLKQHSGHLVNLSASVADRADSAAPSAMTALTKGGLAAVTRSLAVEYASRGIRVNAVAPGIIQTPLHPPEAYTPEALAGQLPPLGRVGQVSDVVDGILYLESAQYVTGETLHVDGGRTAGH